MAYEKKERTIPPRASIWIERAVERNPEESGSIHKAVVNAERQTKLGGGFLENLEAHHPKAALLIKAERYQDIFEELMEYPGTDKNKITDDITLKEQLDKALSGSKAGRKSRKDSMKSSSYQAMLDKLTDRIARGVPEARELIKAREPEKVEKLTPEYARAVRTENRERLRQAIREERNLWRVYDPNKKQHDIIEEVSYTRKDKTYKAWRDFETGRWRKAPNRPRRRRL